jgi:PKHD-type hydroxylase
MKEPKWKSYIVKTERPVLTSQQCDEIIRIGQNEPKIDATIGTDNKSIKVNNKYRQSTISWFPFAKAKTIYQDIKYWTEAINSNHFGFDTPEVTEEGQYAEYTKDDFYNWHIDSNIRMAAMPPVRKISMTLLLNDPKDFEGGDLEIFSGESLDSTFNKINLQKGQAVFFASFLLHRIVPVIKGNRKSLVMWFGGTPLK